MSLAEVRFEQDDAARKIKWHIQEDRLPSRNRINGFAVHFRRDSICQENNRGGSDPPASSIS